MGIAFPACNASTKITNGGLREHLPYLPSWCVCYSVLLLTEELASQPEKCHNGPTSLTMSPPSGSSWPDRKMGWTFEDTVTVPVRWQQLQPTTFGTAVRSIYWRNTRACNRRFGKKEDTHMKKSPPTHTHINWKLIKWLQCMTWNSDSFTQNHREHISRYKNRQELSEENSISTESNPVCSVHVWN